MDKPNKKANQEAEDIATWLARETGHTDGPDGDTEEPDEGIGLPQKRKAELDQFFSGLEVEKAMRNQRRQEAVADVDDAAELRKAIAPRLSEGTSDVAPY